jgi:hypothetical protein
MNFEEWHLRYCGNVDRDTAREGWNALVKVCAESISSIVEEPHHPPYAYYMAGHCVSRVLSCKSQMVLSA